MNDDMDFAFGGLRFRTMAVIPEGALMILDDNGETCATYSPSKGWAITKDATHWRQFAMSPEFAAEFAKNGIRPAPEDEPRYFREFQKSPVDGFINP